MADADMPMDGDGKDAEDKDDILEEARTSFERAVDYENENRATALEDIEFSRKGDQWPADIVKQRQTEGRPCLTINKLPAFIRQVVNDARQNKPSIKVHPVDDQGDPETAAIYDGLIRNIENTSHADIAYDTATEQAVGGGFGYFRIGLDYAYDDSFDLDISINRVANQFSVYGDPNSTSADSSDWNVAHVIEKLTKDEFKAKYPKAEKVDWDGADWRQAGVDWLQDDLVMVCEYWVREEVEKTIVKLSDGTIREQADLTEDEDLVTLLQAGAVSIATDRRGKPVTRTVKSYKVTQRILSGVEVLETRVWPGKYIPIVPVYGDEFFIEGKRYLRSMIHNAIDAQRMHNYWRTTGTELVALAPRVPFIGEEGAFDVDQANWQTANVKSHPYLEYTHGKQPPQRQPLDMGVAAGALQEALNASDDMKSIMGIYDASLGARSNETSGVAINARKMEGDVSTFHFIDNMARAIRHAGCILIDLIPHVYSEERMVRVIGEDGTQEAKQINRPYHKQNDEGQKLMTPLGPNGQPGGEPQPVPEGAQVEQTPVGPMVRGLNGEPVGVPVMAMHDLTVGKYDLVVSTGPGYTTRREEAAAQQIEFIKAFPMAAPIIGDIVAHNLDWDGAEEIADRLKALAPHPPGQGLPPEAQKMMEEATQHIGDLEQQLQKAQTGEQSKLATIKSDELIANEQIASEERIAYMRSQSAERIAAINAASRSRSLPA